MLTAVPSYRNERGTYRLKKIEHVRPDKAIALYGIDPKVEYVTWLVMNDRHGRTQLLFGHYTDSLRVAKRDFNERIKKWSKK